MELIHIYSFRIIVDNEPPDLLRPQTWLFSCFSLGSQKLPPSSLALEVLVGIRLLQMSAHGCPCISMVSMDMHGFLGKLRVEGLPYFKIKLFLGSLVSDFLGFLVFRSLGFKVSWFQSSLASSFRSDKVSKFQRFEDSQIHLMFVDSYWSHITKMPFHVLWKILTP